MKLGDWRNNKDEEVELDGIGGVNILVKADVHRSGRIFTAYRDSELSATDTDVTTRDQLPLLCIRKPSGNGRIREDG